MQRHIAGRLRLPFSWPGLLPLMVCTATLALGGVAGAQTITTFAGGGSATGDGGLAIAARLENPQGIAIDAAGNVYVADSGTFSVRRIDGATGIITTIAGNGQFGDAGDGGPATQAMLMQPIAVAVDASGNVYIVDQFAHRIRRVDVVTGVIGTVVGTGNVLVNANGTNGDQGPAVEAALAFPQDVAVDAVGNLYIADTHAWRVRRVDAATGIITTIAGAFDYGNFSGDGGLAIDAGFTGVMRVAVDQAGNVYVLDPFNVEADFGGNRARVRRIDMTTGIITTVAGGGEGDGEAGPATEAKLFDYNIADIALDGAGYLYIAGAFRVWRVDVAGLISRFAGAGDINSGSTGDGGPATAATFGYLVGIEAAGNGDVYLGDGYSNGRVRKVTLAAGADTTPPVLAGVPDDILVSATSAAGASVGYPLPSASDAVDPAPSVSCVPAPGSAFPLGVTVVTCTATDAAGNSSSAMFTVTVEDTASPLLVCPADQSILAASSSGAVVNYPAATATDLVDPAPLIAYSQASGTLFPIGATVVIVTATDATGNTVQCSFTVTVVMPNLAPVANAGADQTVEATSAAGASVTLDGSASFDPEGAALGITWTGPFGTATGAGPVVALPLGTSTVTLTVSDGQTTAADTVSITVRDTTPPSLGLIRLDLSTSDLAGQGYTVNGNPNFFSADAVNRRLIIADSAQNGHAFFQKAYPEIPTNELSVDIQVRVDGNATVQNTDTGVHVVLMEGRSPNGITGSEIRVALVQRGSADRRLAIVQSNGEYTLGIPFDWLVEQQFRIHRHTNGDATIEANGQSETLIHDRLSGSTLDIATFAFGSFSDGAQATSRFSPIGVQEQAITAAATSAAGAVVTYPVPAPTDAVDPAPTVNCNPASGSTFPIGVTTVTCTATDASSNSTSESFTVTVNFVPNADLSVTMADSPDPTIVGADVSYAIAVTNNGPDEATDVRVVDTLPEGVTFVSATPTQGSCTENTPSFGIVTCNVGSLANGASANITVVVRTTDAPAALTNTATAFFGGSGFDPDYADNTATTTTTVIPPPDITPPVIGVPANVIAEATSAAGAVVTYPAATAVDTLDPSPTVNCAPASGSAFAIGVTTVLCTATDASGNSSTASFTVTVVPPNLAPIANAGPDQIVEATSWAGASVTLDGSASFDPEGFALSFAWTGLIRSSGTASVSPTDVFPLGTHDVTLTVSDGQTTATDAVAITVRDTTAPTIAPIRLDPTVDPIVQGYQTEGTASYVPGDRLVIDDASAGTHRTFFKTIPHVATSAVSVDVTLQVQENSVGLDGFEPGVRAILSEGAGGVEAAVALTQQGSERFISLVIGQNEGHSQFNQEIPFDWSTERTFRIELSAPDPSTAERTVVLTVPGYDSVRVLASGLPAAQRQNPGFEFGAVLDAATARVSFAAIGPMNITADATSPSGAFVTYPTPAASDAVDERPSVGCDPPSGVFILPVGVTTVTCTATDLSGNSGSDTFTVTVRPDVVPPSLTVPGAVSVEATSPAGADVSYPPATAIDNADPAPVVSCAPASGSTFPIGTTTVTCTATDASNNSASQSFAVTVIDVNHNPDALPDSATVAEDSGATTIHVLANDSDMDDDALAVTGVGAPAHGTTALIAAGVTYTPAPNYFGPDAFTYTIGDGRGGVATGTVNVTVTSVNDAPVNTVPGPQGTAGFLPLLFSAAGGNPIAIADVDAGTSPVRVTLTAATGTMTLGGTTGLAFTTGDGTADANMSFTGTLAAVNAALNGMRFTPPFGFTGATGLTITTNDQGQSGAGGPLSDTDTVPITVGPGAGADLAITMTDTPDPVAAGNNLSYSIQVQNTGPSQATTVTVVDVLPSGVTFVSAAASQGACTFGTVPRTVRCDLGSLANRATASVTIVARPTVRATITNRAGVAANQSDPNAANNTATVQTRVN